MTTRTDRDSLARQQFLSLSAKLLSATAPSTSAFLGAEKYRIELQNPDAIVQDSTRTRRKPQPANNDAEDVETCRACGALLLPGSGAIYLLQNGRRSVKTAQSRSSAPNEILGKVVEITCLRCKRQTRTRIQDEEVVIPSRAKVPTHASTQVSDSPVSANARSKERAKNRKQQGLRALLVKNKVEGEINSRANDGMGLGLMDFKR